MCIEQTYLLTELFRYTYHGIISVKPRKDKLSYKILQFGNLFMNKIHLKDIHKLRLLNPRGSRHPTITSTNLPR